MFASISGLMRIFQLKKTLLSLLSLLSLKRQAFFDAAFLPFFDIQKSDIFKFKFSRCVDWGFHKNLTVKEDPVSVTFQKVRDAL